MRTRLRALIFARQLLRQIEKNKTNEQSNKKPEATKNNLERLSVFVLLCCDTQLNVLNDTRRCSTETLIKDKRLVL